jgi:hypothetical protein
MRYPNATSDMHQHTYGSIGKAQDVLQSGSLSSGYIEEVVTELAPCKTSWLTAWSVFRWGGTPKVAERYDSGGGSKGFGAW